MEQISDKEIESQIKKFYQDSKCSFLLPDSFFQSPGGIFIAFRNEDDRKYIEKFLQDETVQNSLKNCKTKIDDSKDTLNIQEDLKNLCLEKINHFVADPTEENFKILYGYILYVYQECKKNQKNFWWFREYLNDVYKSKRSEITHALTVVLFNKLYPRKILAFFENPTVQNFRILYGCLLYLRGKYSYYEEKEIASVLDKCLNKYLLDSYAAINKALGNLSPGFKMNLSKSINLSYFDKSMQHEMEIYNEYKKRVDGVDYRSGYHDVYHHENFVKFYLEKVLIPSKIYVLNELKNDIDKNWLDDIVGEASHVKPESYLDNYLKLIDYKKLYDEISGFCKKNNLEVQLPELEEKYVTSQEKLFDSFLKKKCNEINTQYNAYKLNNKQKNETSNQKEEILRQAYNFMEKVYKIVCENNFTDEDKNKAFAFIKQKFEKNLYNDLLYYVHSDSERISFLWITTMRNVHNAAEKIRCIFAEKFGNTKDRYKSEI